jgi:hypothetical protein
MNRVFLGTCLIICFFGLTRGAFAQASQARRATASQPSVDAPLGSFQAAGPAVGSSSLVVPRLIKFSGVLKDRKGEPKSGAAGVTFAIYAEQEGGAALWMETQNVTLDEGGHYTALLGANSNEGVPVELFTNQWREKDNAETQSSPRSAERWWREKDTNQWRVASGEWREKDNAETQSSLRSAERWLGVEGPELQATARVLLVSVPYALKAADAETLGGMPASAFVLASPQTAATATGGSTSGASQSGTGVATATGPGSSPATTLNATLNRGKPRAATTAATATVDNDFVPKYDSRDSDKTSWVLFCPVIRVDRRSAS